MARFNDVSDQNPFCIRESRAAARYGMSVQWFRLRRRAGDGPPFIRTPTGQILYPCHECDAWFAAQMNGATEQR